MALARWRRKLLKEKQINEGVAGERKWAGFK